MKTQDTLKIETKVGYLNYNGIPVSDDFDYKSFANDNGFYYEHLNNKENTDKFGGVGFVVFKSHKSSDDVSYHLRKTLEILFINELPIMYRTY